MKITQIRNNLKLTQEELAFFLGVSRQHLSLAETDKRNLPNSTQSLKSLLINVVKTRKKISHRPELSKAESQKLSNRLKVARITRDQAKEKYLECINLAETIAANKAAIDAISFKNLPKEDQERLKHWRVMQQRSYDKILNRLNRAALLKKEIAWKTLEAEVACLEAALKEV